MFKRVTGVVALTVLATTMAVTGITGPAFADTGGGCGEWYENVKACISVKSGTTNPLLLDFYVRGFSKGECLAEVIVVYNNSHSAPTERKAWPVSLNRTGRFGPWSEPKAVSHGMAKTLVTVFDCSGSRVLYHVYSPNQTW
jgi:hypothetical protein